MLIFHGLHEELGQLDSSFLFRFKMLCLSPSAVMLLSSLSHLLPSFSILPSSVTSFQSASDTLYGMEAETLAFQGLKKPLFIHLFIQANFLSVSRCQHFVRHGKRQCPPMGSGEYLLTLIRKPWFLGGTQGADAHYNHLPLKE